MWVSIVFYLRAIGHFTVMTAESNKFVGCALARFKDNAGWNQVLLACNYATTNIVNRALYVSGTATSKCESGKSSSYSNLCSNKEVY